MFAERKQTSPEASVADPCRHIHRYDLGKETQTTCWEKLTDLSIHAELMLVFLLVVLPHSSNGLRLNHTPLPASIAGQNNLNFKAKAK
jgi:hypothetical protein